MIDKLHYISQETDNISHLDAIEKTLIAGAKWIQLRVKNKPEEAILELAIKANKLCRTYGARLIVNDHPLIALKAEAYGLHLGLTDMPIAEARSIVGEQMIIGGTANTFDHVKQRVAEGADYIGLGPYRFTNTKQNLSPIIGLEGYEAIMEQVSISGITTPIIAIGGIELADIPLIITTGVHGVAVSGALTNQNDTAAIINRIYENLLAPSS
ncbi:thiamine phosphate synthase [Pedobacter foliorum]|uniref:thiamine phosphate synthase n=1 Tax=Pedobacter foliorum TaxID=2739058 RepID=UPI001565967C|nr:thiamine phosphate synthase [Pedobacter foliorum]NRF41865.1 thiamine phosphate synthase [Pedobacter foliorum]